MSHKGKTRLAKAKPEKFALPPAAFSNAMNDLYPKGWDVGSWPSSPEWRLFNAGRAAAFSDLALEAAGMFTTAKGLATSGGLPR